MTPEDKYPSLMAYIRSAVAETKRRHGTCCAQMKRLPFKATMQTLRGNLEALKRIMQPLK